MDITCGLARTSDGYICYADGTLNRGLLTTMTDQHVRRQIDSDKQYDVIIVGAGFAGLIAARELSHRNRSVLLIEARDRIGGRTLTAEIDGNTYEIGGTWIHWSQPHVWSEMTRYGLSLIESDGAVTDQVTLLLDHGSIRKTVPAADLYPKLFDIMNKFSDIDGANGRTTFPLPHEPMAAEEVIRTYDHLSMRDRLEQISNCFENDDDLRQFIDAYLSMNTQGDLSKSGFLDHMCFWALGDRDTNQMWNKTSRYKIREGMNTLAQAILDDCQNVDLLLSTPVTQIKRTHNNRLMMCTEDKQLFVGLVAIITVPLNALHNIDFEPTLTISKQNAIAHGQCPGGTKFWIKLESPIGSWCGFAPYPNPITVAYTDDIEGTIIVGFGPDNALNIQNIQAVEQELRKFLPECKVKYTFGHDWQNDRFVQSTWSWYRPGQLSTDFRDLQTPEPPLFFASGDASRSWRGCIDGALETGLTVVRHVQEYLRHLSV
jgi:pseudooxynicotine oxidase